MPRALNADEAELWRRVTADMRGKESLARWPLSNATKPLLSALPEPPPGKSSPRPRRLTGLGGTLDGGWDRRLKSGSVTPDRIVDLHGLGLDRAHARIVTAVADAAAAGDRVVLVVTGKPPRAGASRIDTPLRGIIRASLNDWLAASSAGHSIAAIRPAHLRHGGEGALYIVLRRRA